MAVNRSERTALITALGRVNDSEIRHIIADLLRSYVAEKNEQSEIPSDKDVAMGVWTQRLGASLFVFSLGGVFTGTLVGVGAFVGLGAPLVLVGVASAARVRLLNEKAKSKKIADQDDSLAKGVSEIKSESR